MLQGQHVKYFAKVCTKALAIEIIAESNDRED